MRSEYIPEIGVIVHYMSYGTPGGEYPSVCRAAVVTRVPGPNELVTGPNTVDLCVFNPDGLYFNHGVPYDEELSGGSWHWPEAR